MRKLRQLNANILESRGEEEERQKWNLYNEKTHLVKESYLLAICACEFCFTILELSVQKYVIIKRHLESFQNTTVLSESIAIVSYEDLIVMLLRGITWILPHIAILLVCSLMRYLIDRYLCRKTYNRRTILVYGVLSCVFIMLFFIKYTFYFRIFASFVFIFDLFLLLRYRKKLSLVLIGRVREIRQCYGNSRRYQYEYRKYISFRGFSFLFCLGMSVTFLAVLTRLIMNLLTRHMYPCNGVSLLFSIKIIPGMCFSIYCTILTTLSFSLVKSSFLHPVSFIHSFSSSVTVLQDLRNNQVFTMRLSNLLLIDIITIL